MGIGEHHVKGQEESRGRDDDGSEEPSEADSFEPDEAGNGGSEGQDGESQSKHDPGQTGENASVEQSYTHEEAGHADAKVHAESRLPILFYVLHTQLNIRFCLKVLRMLLGTSGAKIIPMTKGRLEAFSDGVLAIIITIMVLELKVPHDPTLEALLPLAPTFLSYILSFIYCGIYWNNHHHLMQAVKTVRGGVLWANLHLLFWLSLVPFVSAWMGEHFGTLPVAAYGVVLFGAAMAYWILVKVLLKHHAPDSPLAQAIGRDFKGTISLVFYIAAIPLAWAAPKISCGLYILVALIWLIPDRRIERQLED